MKIDNNFYMNLALNEAWKYQGLTYPNPAVGCTIVGQNGEILSVEAHQKAGAPHAEVNALKSAFYKLTKNDDILQLSNSLDIHKFLEKNHNDLFVDVSVFTTLEPCSHVGKTPSCANLLAKLGVKKVYVGSIDSNTEASDGNKILINSSIDVDTSILKDECDDLLRPFELWQKKNFVFFKWAQRLNGTTDNGIITSKETRKFTHAMRDVCDLLVIGGNTVREDRPTLDARDVGGKAPDILIYSKSKDFDKTIPLFNIDGRKVIISDSFNELENYKNIMIEGTSNMYELTRDIVDYYLCYVAPKLGGVNKFENNEDKFNILNLQKGLQDIIMWIKRQP